MNSRDVPAAQNPFDKVLTGATSSEDKDIKALGRRCLLPGLYAQHLERWLMYYPSSKVCKTCAHMHIQSQELPMKEDHFQFWFFSFRFLFLTVTS